MTSPFDAPLAAGQAGRYRDLVLLGISRDTMICIAADSSGGYGAKPHDVRFAEGHEVGYAVAKVPLMEVLAAGAHPRVLINNLCVEMDPTGIPILEGLRAACAEAGGEIEVSGSDETNIPTTTTGVGTTVVAILSREQCRLGTSRPGDLLVAVGLPLGGQPATATYQEGSREVSSIRTVARLLRIAGVHEVLPVGSRGIAYETRELAACVGQKAKFFSNTAIDLSRSAGASTTVICSVDPTAVDELASVNKVTTVYGSLG